MRPASIFIHASVLAQRRPLLSWGHALGVVARRRVGGWHGGCAIALRRHYSRREVAASRIIKRTRGQRCERTKGGERFCRGWVKSRMLEDELEARLAAETSRSVLKKRRPGGEGGEVVHTYGVFRRTPRR